MSKKILISTIFIAFSAMAMAQQKEAVQDSIQLEEVVVTALKVETPLRETAKQVQIISREQIGQSAGKDLSQLLQEQSGLIINNANANPAENKSVFMRGASNQFTLILIDGNPVNDPSGIGGAFDLRLFPIEHIERIEILKGSQSTLYGTDAIAGVINIITNKEYEKTSVYGGASYGSMNSFKANVGVKGRKDFIDYNINFLRNSSDGISSATDPTNSGSFDKDGFLQRGFQSSLDINVNEKLTFSPFFRFEDFDGDYDADAFTDAPNTLTMKFVNPGAAVAYKSGNLLARVNYSFNLSDREFQSTWGVSPFKGKLHNAEIYLSKPLNQYMQLIGGVNYQHYKMADGNADPKNPHYSIFSPFATVILKGMEGFYMETGYRLNSHSVYGANSTYNISPAYWVANRLKIFASFNTGFKSPTLSQLYGPFGANDKLKPQVSQSTELGLNYVSVDDKTDAQVTYYRRKIDDLIDYSYDPGYFNRDRQEDEGVEILVNHRLFEKVNVTATYDFVTGKNYTLNENGEDTTFNNLIRRPKSKLSLNVNYQPVSRMNISLFGLYMGERTDIFFDAANNYAETEVTLDPYFLLNAYVDYSLVDGKVRVFADFKNILNEEFTEVYGYNTIGFNAIFGFRFEL